MEKKDKRGEVQDSQLFVWQGYTGKVELFSFTTFLTRPVRRVALGEDHSLILTYSDNLFACGRNEYGQLGNPDPNIREYSYDPCLVEGMSGKGITHIACGANHSACVTKDGRLYLWGENLHGQCGANPKECSILSPRLLELSFPKTTCQHGVTSPGIKETPCCIACGASHSIAKTTEGNIWVWGSGPTLGMGDKDILWTPKVLEKFRGRQVLEICCGDFHTAVLIKEEQVAKKKSPSEEYSVSKQTEYTDPDKGPSDEKDVSEEKENLVKTVSEKDVVSCELCKSEKQKTEAEGQEAEAQGDIEAGSSSIVNLKDVNLDLDQSLGRPDAEGADSTIQSNEKTDKRKVAKSLDFETEGEGKEHEIEVEGTESQKKDRKQPPEADDKQGNLESKLKSQTSEEKKPEEISTEGVEMRKKGSPESLEDLLTASVRSDMSVVSNKSVRSCVSTVGIINDRSTREFLAKQFQDEEPDKDSDKKGVDKSDKLMSLDTASGAPSSPGTFMVSTVTSLTSTVSTMTTKTISNIASLPGKFLFSSTAAEEEEKKSSTETLEKSEISDVETGSSENLTSDRSLFDFSYLTSSDISLNVSQFSVAESEKSEESGSSVESSPRRSKKSQSTQKVPQSIRTIEAKQENLRKRSLSLHGAEEKQRKEEPAMKYTLNTEVWTWGKNSKGQLGSGDMLDRSEPTCVNSLTGHRIVKLACGSSHTLALSSTGEVYSWGLNESGQLARTEFPCSPEKIELAPDCSVWSVDGGSNHSVFLVDNAKMQGTRPEGFYAGKHPTKELYVPIYMTNKLTHMKFLKKAGWMCSIASGGDHCGCLSRQETDFTCMVFELIRFVRELHRQLQQIRQEFVKRIQISGFYTSLETKPYNKMLRYLLDDFTELTYKFGIASSELTDRLVQGESILKCMLFVQYEDFITKLKNFTRVFADMVAAGGFEFCVKTGSSLFENLQEFYPQLLKTSPDTKPDHANKFRQIMYTPLMAVKDLSGIINRFSELFDKSTKENNLLSSVHLNMEHFVRTSMTTISDADNTRMFWDSSTPKITESLRSPKRRLIKESRSSPLVMLNAGRFSTHTFYLFNDMFIHSQYAGHQSYPLETVWIDAPSSDPTATQQNIITVTTPEEVLILTTTTPQIRVEWVMAFNTAINKVLASQKSVSRQNSGDRVQTPVVRLAKHTFTKHPLFKEATYRGYWLNGKVHGSGLIKWPDGRRYKGKFQHGTITGSGKMTIPKESKTEEVQEGVWKDSKLHGHSKIIYSTGDMYEGFMKEGLRHGHGVFRKGRYLSSASFVYVGEWLNDKKHGYGVMDDILKGEKYMGMWQEDKRHGDGVVVTLDGMYFEGNFQLDKLVGHGLMLTDDNSCYEGEFAGITMLQGKGCLTFPGGDKIDGTFSGTWNQGLRISGTFHKNPLSGTAAVKHLSFKSSPESMSSLFGKLCVKPERKWQEIFYQCYESLGYMGTGEPNTTKAWDQVVACIVAGKQKLKEHDRRHMSSKQKMELSNLEQLETIPVHSVEVFSIEHFQYIVQYLHRAFEADAHPLGKLMHDLVDVFRAAFIGIGAHPRLLYHAVQEIKSYMKRIYKVLRILFPELPVSGDPSHVYPERKHRACTPIKESMGVLQQQISELDENTSVEVVSAAGILQPILLPKIYPALFDLYALHSDKDDEKYWERVQKLNKQGDMALMAYLGIDQNFWCMDAAVLKENKTRISSIRDHSYAKAVDVLQQISTAFCPLDKLEVIKKAFLAITETLQEEHVWCMDELFPIFQFVVIRARIHHLGAEIKFIEELMESYLEFGELGIMFTTLKACYFQVQNEKIPIH